MRNRVGIEPSVQALGINEHTYLTDLPHQALNSYNDQCAPANPRMPLMTHMEDLMRTAYYGTSATP